MKLTKRNQPVLDMLYRNILDKVKIYEKDDEFFNKLFDKFHNTWKKYNTSFLKDIFVVSPTFADAVLKSKSKLLYLYADIIKNNTEDIIIEGTVLVNDMVYMISMDIKKDTDIVDVVFYMFSKDGFLLGITTNQYYKDIDKSVMITWLSSAYGIFNKEAELKIRDIQNNCICLFAFKKYADVETKILLPKSKNKSYKNKYINDTNLKVTYLDSKWFTTLVKSDAFKVSGHFRLQPIKVNGKWDTKLIYINDFEKSGYTAKARKLSQSII